MPPVHRYHQGTVLVPTVLLAAVDWMFGVTDGSCEDFGLYPVEACELERVCTVPRLGNVAVPMDAAAFSRARNVLDGWTLSDECLSPNATWVLGVDCDFCLWCQSLVLRDWCDEVLDRAGFLDRSPYITIEPDADSGALYDNTWRQLHEHHG